MPARVLAGRWAKSSKPGAIVGDVQYYQQHVKAEFYAERIGWVPVDLSSAVEHDHSPAGLQYFGRDQGNFLTIHIDPLVQVDTLHFGRQTFTWLQGVHYYASGKGTLRNKVIDEQWRVNWLGAVQSKIGQSSLIGGIRRACSLATSEPREPRAGHRIDRRGRTRLAVLAAGVPLGSQFGLAASANSCVARIRCNSFS